MATTEKGIPEFRSLDRLQTQMDKEMGDVRERVSDLEDTIERYEVSYPEDIHSQVRKWHNQIGYIVGSVMSQARQYLQEGMTLQEFNNTMSERVDNIDIVPQNVVQHIEMAKTFNESMHLVMFVIELLKKRPPTIMWDCELKGEEEREKIKEEDREDVRQVIREEMGRIIDQPELEEDEDVIDVETKPVEEEEEVKEAKEEIATQPAKEMAFDKDKKMRIKQVKDEITDIFDYEEKLEPKDTTVEGAMEYIIELLSRVTRPYIPRTLITKDMERKGFGQTEIETAIEEMIDNDMLIESEEALIGDTLTLSRKFRNEMETAYQDEDKNVYDIDSYKQFMETGEPTETDEERDEGDVSLESFIEEGKEKFKPDGREYQEEQSQLPFKKKNEAKREGVKNKKKKNTGNDSKGEEEVTDVELPKNVPEWAKEDTDLSKEERKQKFPICYLTKGEIRLFGMYVIGNNGEVGLNEKQYKRVKKGMNIYREGRVRRVGEEEWVVLGDQDTYLIGLRDDRYVHLDTIAQNRDWGQRADKGGTWCKHIVAVHIFRRVDCGIEQATFEDF